MLSSELGLEEPAGKVDSPHVVAPRRTVLKLELFASRCPPEFSMSISIRPAEYRDADAVLAMAKSFATSFVVEEQAFRESFSQLLASPQANHLVAESARQIVGYLLGFEYRTFYANGPVAWVEELMSSEPYRRQKIGRALMQEFEAWALAKIASWSPLPPDERLHSTIR